MAHTIVAYNLSLLEIAAQHYQYSVFKQKFTVYIWKVIQPDLTIAQLHSLSLCIWEDDDLLLNISELKLAFINNNQRNKQDILRQVITNYLHVFFWTFLTWQTQQKLNTKIHKWKSNVTFSTQESNVSLRYNWTIKMMNQNVLKH